VPLANAQVLQKSSVAAGISPPVYPRLSHPETRARACDSRRINGHEIALRVQFSGGFIAI
jgi:hypothetical protein